MTMSFLKMGAKLRILMLCKDVGGINYLQFKEV